MTTIASSRLREVLSDTLNKVAYQHERIILERHGKGFAAIIPLEDLKLLEELEDKIDTLEAEMVQRNLKKEDLLLWDDVKKDI